MKKKLDLLTARWGGFTSPLIVVGATNADKQNAKEVAADTRARANAYTKTGASERLSVLVDAALALPVATPADITALFGRKYPGTTKTVDGSDLKDAMVKDWDLRKAPTLRFMSAHNQWGPVLTPMQTRACVSAKLLCEQLDRLEALYKTTQPQGRGESGGVFGGTPFLGGAMALLLLVLSWLPASAQELALPFDAGQYAMLQIQGADTTRLLATVGEWRPAQDVAGGVFCPVRIGKRIAVVRIMPSGAWWNNTPIVPTPEGVIYVNPARPDGVEVRLVFVRAGD